MPAKPFQTYRLLLYYGYSHDHGHVYIPNLVHNSLDVKPGVHTNDFATIHGRPVRIHTAPAEDNTSNQQSTPQALCEYGRGDRES